MDKDLKTAVMIVSVFNMFKPNSACVAGGYLRDITLGRLPKDIDILVEYNSKEDYRELEILADRFGYSLANYSEGYEDELDGEQLRFVAKLSKVGCLDIDVIFLNCTCRERIDNFPVNISQIWTEDGKYICPTREFNDGWENKKLVFNTNNCSEEYKQRMIGYFPDYAIGETCQTKKT